MLRNHLEQLLNRWGQAQNPVLTASVEHCKDPRHGHFQTNMAMIHGKTLGRNPRELANEIVEFCKTDSQIESISVAGPGFINFTLKRDAILNALKGLQNDPSLGLAQAKNLSSIVIDYSAPNVAKPMHVGHIRSTILGEVLARILRAVGHKVIGDNHLGDWGTQFGMMILGYKRNPHIDPQNAIVAMENIYKEINAECKDNANTLEEAKQELVKLQNGDAENLRIWQLFRDLSQEEFDSVYNRLGVKFDVTLGESFYNPWLKDIVSDLLEKKIAVQSEGAVVIFFPENDALKDNPFLIQKADGASLYSTTDLATIQYRVREFKADRMIYVVDGRQQLHFQQLFAAARKWGYDKVVYEHAWFGSILGKDKKPFKTREGGVIKLKELLDEAESRALAILKEKRPDLSNDKAPHLARIIGLGALKYADLAQNRNLDYIFDWDKLLAFDGNTAPYLINAYVRTRSILRKAGSFATPESFDVEHDLDLELARKLLDFSDVVQLIATELRPHHLCVYLYELASLFHRFFENCPVLQAGRENLKWTRLALCSLTGDVLRKGLNLLSIETVEEM
jgi:arginyl-tRNA synthetase